MSFGGEAGPTAPVDQAGTRQPQPITTVTLRVPSTQVEAITAAKWAGEIDLVLLASAPQPTSASSPAPRGEQ